jgi:FecR protein
MTRRTLALILSSAISISSSAMALQTAPAPEATSSTAPADASVEALKITVTGVEGIVQVRADEDQPWQRATKGMVVDQNAEFRTSLRSAVQIQIPPDQTITLDRLGTIRVVEAVNDSGKLKTKIGMKYGRARYDIESAGQEHEASISSPSSTLAIRGTVVTFYDQRPFPIEATSLTGRALFQDAKKQVYVGKKNGGTLKVDQNSDNPAAYALSQAVVDPSIALARSESEQPLIDAVLSTGATLSYDQQKGIKVVTGGRPLTDAELIPALPGVVDFVLRWTGNADLNLGVISPGTGSDNRTVYPIAGYNITKNGGSTAFDHRGGPHGGIEVASWPANFPEGTYRIGVTHVSGPDTPATVDVFLNGKRIPINNTPQGTSLTSSFVSAPIPPAFEVAGFAAGTVTISPQATTSSKKHK